MSGNGAQMLGFWGALAGNSVNKKGHLQLVHRM